MSDRRLRELERRWKESADPRDESAWLLERVRSGQLTRERLELGLLLREDVVNDSRINLLPPWGWIRQIAPYGPEALARAAVALVELRQPRSSSPHTEDVFLRTAESILTWSDCPCLEHEDEVREMMLEAESTAQMEYDVRLVWIQTACRVVWVPDPQDLVEQMTRGFSGGRVREVVRDTLLPWVFGDSRSSGGGEIEAVTF